MAHCGERGSTLLETTIAIGLVALVAGSALSAVSATAGAAGRTAVQATLQDAAESESRIAIDVLKYSGSTLVPRTVATSVPMPAGSPLPVTMTLSVQAQANGGTSVAITAVAVQDPSQRVTIYAALDRRAPLPGTQLRAPGLVPAPTGAP